jgi:hypothetical protein
MSFILMMVGFLAIALGAILIGFGIPINEFSLGNTLILAGTVTATGGLVTFAISRAVAQLARMSELLATRPVGAPAAAATPAAAPVAPPAPPRAPQPRAQHNDEFELPEMVEPVRPSAPRAPIPATEEAAPVAPPSRPSGWRPPRPSAERPAKAPEPRRPAAPDPAPVAPRREPTLDAPAETAGRAEAATVLKSGVVDGMAYTLYTDGSIEAELAQGVVRFGSIEELRNHLEKSS